MTDTDRRAERAEESDRVEEGDRVEKSDDDWRRELTEEQFRVTRRKGTEPPFSGDLLQVDADGVFRCVCCGAALFSTLHKYESGSGWPSFWQAVAEGALRTEADTSHGMRRTEVLCARCDAHLGHVFPDGPPSTGARYCINSAALRLDPAGEAGGAGEAGKASSES